MDRAEPALASAVFLDGEVSAAFVKAKLEAETDNLMRLAKGNVMGNDVALVIKVKKIRRGEGNGKVPIGIGCHGVGDCGKCASAGGRLGVFTGAAAGENAQYFPIENSRVLVQVTVITVTSILAHVLPKGFHHSSSIWLSFLLWLLPFATLIDEISQQGNKSLGFLAKSGVNVKRRGNYLDEEGICRLQVVTQSVGGGKIAGRWKHLM